MTSVREAPSIPVPTTVNVLVDSSLAELVIVTSIDSLAIVLFTPTLIFASLSVVEGFTLATVP